ncbi:MAG: O-antigen ligase family protein [Patescibacteria group bacterium]|nr:O-antigen ligase family protein [Patescibacteria group bacterium]
MSNLINFKIFKLVFFSLAVAEILSFLGWKFLLINNVCFWALAVLVLILSLKKIEYGLYFIFAELFVGSFGYLFSFNFGGTKISLRVMLFLIVMAVWLVNQIKNIRHSERSASWRRAMESQSPNKIPPSRWPSALGMTEKKWLLIFTGILLLSFLHGLLRGNGFANIFLDFNNWLYFLLLLPVLSIVKLKKSEFTNTLISILAAAALFLSLKTLFLFYVFSHADGGLWTTIYKFIRDTLSGEVTHVSGNIFRIFIQSQVYLLILFFLLLPQISNFPASPAGRQFPISKKNTNYKLQITNYALLVACLLSLILSFSRSFWVGLGVGVFVFLVGSLSRVRSESDESRDLGTSFLCKKGMRFLGSLRSLGINGALAFARNFAKILGVVVLALFVAFLALILPPQRDENAFLNALQGRFGVDAAASSRISQIKPLTQEILKSPFIGFGFGKTITYNSNDPRLVPQTAGGSGKITTYAFEWGYLDMVLKFGVVGILVYLFLIFTILKRLVNVKAQILNVKNELSASPTGGQITNYELQITNYRLRIGFALALISLLTVNIFSPYLNHPLGIGFIVLSFALMF